MLNLTCDRCGASAPVTDGTDPPDSALTCGCCPQDHHHGLAAMESGVACRPITITVGQVQVGPAGGMN